MGAWAPTTRAPSARAAPVVGEGAHDAEYGRPC
jgi:hypothetical protein